MAVIRNTYAADTSIQTYYVRIQKNTDIQEGVIISDDGPINMEVNEQTIVWLKVETDCQITVLVSQPSNVNAFTPSHANFDKMRILVKSAETFVVEHSSTIMSVSTQTAVTGYQQGAFDIIYIKIDHSNNNVTVYS
ncbi:MAG TPA: hypothetical protein PK971_01855 [Saprospiraceae bacterium]|nr:hypothetical protein [Saprospiraceae bacterium]HND87038.1 hypothetical protein [Saprospiraceae bacterium]